MVEQAESRKKLVAGLANGFVQGLLGYSLTLQQITRDSGKQ